MPIYEFKCLICNSQYEVMREMGEERQPVCCGISMERVWSAPGIIFKGPGFYKTDNR
jgi:putative FmdB family regulatory protein